MYDYDTADMDKIRQILLAKGVKRLPVSWEAGNDEVHGHVELVEAKEGESWQERSDRNKALEAEILEALGEPVKKHPWDNGDHDWRLYDFGNWLCERFTPMRDYEFSPGASGSFVYDVERDAPVPDSGHGVASIETEISF